MLFCVKILESSAIGRLDIEDISSIVVRSQDFNSTIFVEGLNVVNIPAVALVNGIVNGVHFYRNDFVFSQRPKTPVMVTGML